MTSRFCLSVASAALPAVAAAPAARSAHGCNLVEEVKSVNGSHPTLLPSSHTGSNDLDDRTAPLPQILRDGSMQPDKVTAEVVPCATCHAGVALLLQISILHRQVLGFTINFLQRRQGSTTIKWNSGVHTPWSLGPSPFHGGLMQARRPCCQQKHVICVGLSMSTCVCLCALVYQISDV